jgi:hypothetical protein
MLHASAVTMVHPLTGAPLRVTAPLPDDFRQEAARRGLPHAAPELDESSVAPP